MIVSKQDQKKLVKILQELMEFDGNKDLVDEVLNAVNIVSPQDELSKQSVIYRINEHCIEDVSRKQAEEFYADFPIEEIKEQLISDFVQMEHQRRRDDFENFCLCMYQQIEGVVKYYKHLNEKQWVEFNSIKVVDDESDKISLLDMIQPLSDEGRYYSNLKSDQFKSRIVLYVLISNKSEYTPSAFKEIWWPLYDIYKIRNLNHRGGWMSDRQRRIIRDKPLNYLRFYGFLSSFKKLIKTSNKYMVVNTLRKQL